MSLTTSYLALGSNLGQRLEQMRSALRLLDEKGIVVSTASPVYENRAIGMGRADSFLNAVVEVRTALEPDALLKTCLAVESKLGRVRSGVWAPRTIDIDLLTYGELQMETEQLQLPHPRITERDFVLQPFADIAPDFKLHGQSMRAWLNKLPVFELTRIADELIKYHFSKNET
jgi:2-amino-4-hydroxy-6-hydroxymethyldihydropteridine diphosphokinase